MLTSKSWANFSFFKWIIYSFFRFKNFSGGAVFGLFSRESGLILNNLLLTVSALVIFLGTIWPFIIEAILNEQVSVGEPFYEVSLTPFVVIFAFMLPVVSKVGWRSKNFGDIRKVLSLIIIMFY